MLPPQSHLKLSMKITFVESRSVSTPGSRKFWIRFVSYFNFSNLLLNEWCLVMPFLPKLTLSHTLFGLSDNVLLIYREVSRSACIGSTCAGSSRMGMNCAGWCFLFYRSFVLNICSNKSLVHFFRFFFVVWYIHTVLYIFLLQYAPTTARSTFSYSCVRDPVTCGACR